MNVVFAEPRAAYIHVPFCAHRCGYCDFTVIAGKDHLAGDYLRAMATELAALESPRTIDTLFFGGGTPTRLAPGDLKSLFEIVQDWMDCAPGAEISVEANPADLSNETIDVLVAAGVNRISLGAQSFDSNVLVTLERDHIGSDIESSVNRLSARVSSISLDLIFGVPGQSLRSWKDTLARAVSLGIDHVSTYGLTYEKGTSFGTRRAKGALVPVAEDLEREMYDVAMNFMEMQGFEQYEISSFAKPGHRCRHNETYWKGHPYFGFGPGAARYLNGRRETNHRSVTTWMNRILNGKPAVGEAEVLSDENRARESIALGLRRCVGVHRENFRTQTGYDLDELAGDAIRRQRELGYLVDVGSHVRLTHAGKFVADSVVGEFL